MLTKIKSITSKLWLKISFFVLGLGSLIWFLVRVIPKPSRAQYPCMKAAAPFASSFVCYLIGISTLGIVFKKAKQQFQKSKYLAALGFVVIGLIAGGWAIFNNSEKASATVLADDQPVNKPIGDAKGIFPGRVVWAHDANATNENCTNSNDDFWFMDKNTNQSVVSNMVSKSIQQLTGATSDAVAWDSIFHYYNRTHGRGNVGYTAGEKIVIKLNLNGLANDSWSNPKAGNINTSPQVCYAVLDQLINVVHVAQSDIGIGDPSHDMNNDTYNPLHKAFSKVEYWGTSSGRTRVSGSDEKVIFYSDGSGIGECLPQKYLDATYMINIPVFKKHHRAGISLCCKNHVGSISPYSEFDYSNAHWHLSLPAPYGVGENTNGDYGVYRFFVDVMGHKDLGGKTILYLVDGIWGSTNWGHPAVKWAMAPFNNDYPNSLFLSLDPVAIESVCFDFLYYEFDENNPTEGGTPDDTKGPFPHFRGVDDYLHQAADPANWPAGIKYDPEDDGTILKSMGTHEHWNNAIDMQYSRNLSYSGNGIELYKASMTGIKDFLYNNSSNEVTNYPNPVKGSTTFQFNLSVPSEVTLSIYTLSGKRVSFVQFGRLESGIQHYSLRDRYGLPSQNGIYNYVLEVNNKNGRTQLTNKLVIEN
jgi:hypothetical protein